ncbi:hypothetical protein Ae706Ps2_6523 [Pseudonocardia sp. Ae706_Ps2]|nr:hypothetical protein Ae706Ps2_6515 [Pseudonocardia sp. Ae706_Ps2]OLM09324.1 hypothetical protein Ae706Ps2_6517 [Pseudonocardia sp. Ae706_Ps2]OLM09330.1 hypothetical protein Ae706Ps2_6523 [Pseudonocardia sp. Ae706_Ps2]
MHSRAHPNTPPPTGQEPLPDAIMRPHSALDTWERESST